MSGSKRRSTPTRSPRRGPSRLTVGFGLVVLAAVALLGVAFVFGPLADAWHPVVSVDGRTVNRSELRARMALDAVLIDARRTAAKSLLSAGRMTASDYDRIQRLIDADAVDPLRTAIDGLVADSLIRQEASTRALSPTVDPVQELALAAQAEARVHLRAITISQPHADAPAGDGTWPAPAPNASSKADLAAAMAAALTEAHASLAAGSPVADVAASLQAAGWRATAWDAWIPAVGPVDGLPDAFLARLRDPTTVTGSVLDGEMDAVTGTAAIGTAVETQASSPITVTTAGVDGGVLHAWAEARADEGALRATLRSTWENQPQPLVRAAELVVGPSDVSGVNGEYRSFAHLVIGQLPPATRGAGSDPDVAGRIAAQLRALAPADRVARFETLVAEANAASAADALHTSGEIGFFTRDQLLPALGDLAFGSAVVPGDVLGPVTTAAGTELFLLRARFVGTLDDRSNAALVEARSTPDLLAMARQVSPAGEWARADGTIWRTELELGGSADALAAYRDTGIGAPSSPFVLDGEILVVQPLERVTGAVPPDALARLATRGFEAWLAERTAGATIIRDAQPLPGIEVASPTLSASVDPFASVGGIPTPQLPQISFGP